MLGLRARVVSNAANGSPSVTLPADDLDWSAADLPGLGDGDGRPLLMGTTLGMSVFSVSDGAKTAPTAAGSAAESASFSLSLEEASLCSWLVYICGFPGFQFLRSDEGKVKRVRWLGLLQTKARPTSEIGISLPCMTQASLRT